jgi:hypothetical protein
LIDIQSLFLVIKSSINPNLNFCGSVVGCSAVLLFVLKGIRSIPLKRSDRGVNSGLNYFGYAGIHRGDAEDTRGIATALIDIQSLFLANQIKYQP